MNKFRFTINALAVAIFLTAFASLAQAQATRTWVSGVGDDVNPCSRTAPCKTYAGAISKTAKDGEISTLDPGGFGAVTITKSITINGGGAGAGYGSILAALTNGIIINITDPADVRKSVRLDWLNINGASTGINGIRFLSGTSLYVTNCVIDGFTTNGIDALNSIGSASKVHVRDTIIRNIGGSGILLQANNVSGNMTGELQNVNISNAGIGLNVNQRVHAAALNCTFANNSSAGVAVSGLGGEDATIDSSQIVYNGDGVQTNQAFARVGNCLIAGNGNGLHQIGGVLESYGTNRNRGNGNNTLGTITPVLPS